MFVIGIRIKKDLKADGFYNGPSFAG